jgi:hypothetical protein
MNATPPPRFFFKYVWPGGIGLLSDWRIKAGLLKDFNDPFECMPAEVNASRRDVKRHTKSKLMKREVYRANVAHNRAAPRFKEFKRQLTPDRMRDIVDATIRSIESSGAEYGGHLKDTLLRHWGVCCLSKVPDSILMWSHYADSQKGFVVGFKGDHPFWQRGPGLHQVRYSRNRSKHVISHPTESEEDRVKRMLELICTKSLVWEYEHEWRALFPIKPKSEDNQPHLIDLPEGIVHAVYGGPRIEPKLEDTIRRIGASRGFAHHRAKLHPTEFAIEVPPLPK